MKYLSLLAGVSLLGVSMVAAAALAPAPAAKAGALPDFCKTTGTYITFYSSNPSGWAVFLDVKGNTLAVVYPNGHFTCDKIAGLYGIDFGSYPQLMESDITGRLKPSVDVSISLEEGPNAQAICQKNINGQNGNAYLLNPPSTDACVSIVGDPD